MEPARLGATLARSLGCLSLLLTLSPSGGPATSQKPGPAEQDERQEHQESEERESRPSRGPRQKSLPGPPLVPMSGPPTWRCLGPLRGSSFEGSTADLFQTQSGRTTVVLTHPTEPFTLYIAGTGGAFRSKNADPDAAGEWTWTALLDAVPLPAGDGLAVGDLAMSPADPKRLYAGLGEPLSDLMSGALLISGDGGDSWSQGGSLGESGFVWKILPIDESVVLVGTDVGLFRSGDGGKTFVPSTFDTGQPAGPGAVQSLLRLADGTILAGRFSVQDGTFGRLYASKDGGVTFQQGKLPDALPSPLLGRFSLATAPSSCCTAYAITDNVNSVLLEGVFRTDDSGKSWTFVAPTSGGFDQGQGFYNQALAVDPDDASHLFVGVQGGFYRSLDGGASWQAVAGYPAPQMHADSHVARWSKTGPKTLLIGHDGGLSLMRDPLRPTVPSIFDPPDVSFLDNRRNRGLSTDQLYSLASTTAATPQGSRDLVIVGTQDNGLITRRDDGSGLGASGTFDVTFSGDGYGTVLHPHDGSLALAGINGTVLRSLDGGAHWATMSAGIGETLLWDIPFTLGEADPSGNTVYVVGSDHIFRSGDFGLIFAPLARAGVDADDHFTAVAASRTDALRLAAATYTNLYVSLDGGDTWQKTSAPPLTTPRQIWIDGFDPDTLYATAQDRTSASRLCRSPDRGATWQPLDSEGHGFPTGAPVYLVKTDPLTKGTLYAGTDAGLFVSTDSGASWSPLGIGLPRVPVRDIYLAPDGSFVRVATYGRGVWESSLGGGGAGGSGGSGAGGAGAAGAGGAGAAGQGGAGAGGAGAGGLGGAGASAGGASSAGSGGADAGSAGAGGAAGAGAAGSAGAAGTAGEGGAAGQGAVGGTAGANAAGASGGAGATAGGKSGTGGASGANAAGASGAGAAGGAGGKAGGAGASGASGGQAGGGPKADGAEGGDGGCSCRQSAPERESAPAGLLVLALALARRRARRSGGATQPP